MGSVTRLISSRLRPDFLSCARCTVKRVLSAVNRATAIAYSLSVRIMAGILSKFNNSAWRTVGTGLSKRGWKLQFVGVVFGFRK